MEKAKEYTSEEQQWLTENRLSRFQNRITPSWIRDMGENEIFVFGSNVNYRFARSRPCLASKISTPTGRILVPNLASMCITPF